MFTQRMNAPFVDVLADEEDIRDDDNKIPDWFILSLER